MTWPGNYPRKEKEKKKQSGILDDIGLGFYLAAKNWLSYALAVFGIIILTIFMLVIVVFVVAIPLIAFVGLSGLIDFFVSFSIAFSATEGIMLVAIVVIIVLPILWPFFAAIGALYGLSREIVESEGTRAESAFTWYRKRALALAGGGTVHFLVTLAPIALAFLSISYPVWNPPTEAELAFLLQIALVWVLLANGMLSLTMPGIIDGLSAIKAAGRSIKLTCFAPLRVFGVWATYMLIIGLPVAPIIWGEIFPTQAIIPADVFEQYVLGIGLILVFLVLPALTISLTRVYMIVSAKLDRTFETAEEEGSK
jgi:hypothetical protein